MDTGEWSANKADLAKAVWDRLLGFFGDALLRKFGAAPPPEWENALPSLDQVQLERGMRRLLFGWKGGPPSLPDFMRLCRSVADDSIDEGPRPLVLPPPDTRTFDGWALTANNRFWKYITKRLTDKPRAWGFPGSTRQADATRIAVAYKNAWAQDMRDEDRVDASTGELVQVSRAIQDSTWVACMGRAEADIALAQMQKKKAA